MHSCIKEPCSRSIMTNITCVRLTSSNRAWTTSTNWRGGTAERELHEDGRIGQDLMARNFDYGILKSLPKWEKGAWLIVVRALVNEVGRQQPETLYTRRWSICCLGGLVWAVQFGMMWQIQAQNWLFRPRISQPYNFKRKKIYSIVTKTHNLVSIFY